ncbi:hypothetical protein BJ138DRAFT_1137337 [Hygrophoropsis aurantiaca]|uniref:Uncharacterized protein n=1 Tax=Hygrophoropsis aurantiaca TaxID=72124 RepID=A0ACB8A438_9AGAM|nr:hypothetical protein BJ138DRAFT_1137337 [Hygrophoropsis aurantiaca]
MTDVNPSNSLGLDFDSLQIADPTEPSVESPIAQSTDEPSRAVSSADAKDKKKPYINPERVKTGGTQREKLSEEELAERMLRIKGQNEKIKQRRLDVQADENAFKKTQEAERIRQAHIRKEQEHVDRTREQNARRKMDKIQSREWDSGKPTGDWKQPKRPVTYTESPESETITQPVESNSIRSRGGTRGGGSTRARGRGRGGSSGHVSSSTATENVTTLPTALDIQALPAQEPTPAEISSS